MQRSFGLERIVAAVGVMVFSLGAWAGVFDDASFWFDGAKVGTSGRTFVKGDAIDLINAADSAHVNHLADKLGSMPKVVDSSVKRNLCGDTVTQQSLLFHQGIKDGTQVYDETTSDLVSAKATTFQALVLADSLGVLEHGKTFSMVIRFKPALSLLGEWAEAKKLKSNGYRSTLLCIGGETPSHGMILNLEYDNANNSPGKYVIGMRQGRFNRQLPALGLLEVDKWYELAVSARLGASDSANYCRVMLTDENGTVTFADCLQNGTTPYWNPASNESRKIAIASSRDDNWQNDEVINSESSWFRSYNGEIAMLAFWNRSLTDAEMREAVVYPTSGKSATVNFGIKNGSSGEFAGNASGSSVAATVPSAWRSFPSELSADGVSSGSIRFSLTDRDDYLAGTDQLLRIFKSSGNGDLTVTVGDCVEQVVWTHGTGFAHIPGSCLASGEHILTLTCTKGSVKLDYLTLGGSWQVGYDDGKNTEFGDLYTAKLHTYSVEDNDFALCSSGYAGTGTCGLFNLKFKMDEFTAEYCPTYFSTKCIQTSIGTYPHVFLADVYVNGVLYRSGVRVSPFVKGGDSTVDGVLGIRFPRNTFVAGENTITVQNVTSELSWSKNDYFKFEVEKPQGIYGMVFLVR